MAEHQFDLSESNEHHLILPDLLPRQKSNDSIFAELLRASTYGERPLLFPYNPNQQDQVDCPKIFKPKKKKEKVKKACAYRKNICGYITKKILREYLSASYKAKVQQLCNKHNCDYNQSKSYFLSKIQNITGPSHVPTLFIPSEEWQRPIKAAFKEFFIWFCKERYLRYLILEGKMEQKQAYIEYKNTVLMGLINNATEMEKKKERKQTSLEHSSV